MIITRTPLRISFAGGGTDLRAFYVREYGAVVSTAIDKYIYITVNKKFDDKIRVSYSVTEIVDCVDDLKHELIREALKLTGITGGVEITSISDVPSYGTGLGSSSSYVVGLLNALHAYLGYLPNAEQLAREACGIEIDVLGKSIGKQDQYIAAYGGVQYIKFNPDETVFVDPVIGRRDLVADLQRNLLLLYTGITRSADSVLVEQKSNTQTDGSAFSTLHSMRNLANEARDLLASRNFEGFGRLLHEGWMMKKSLATGISSSDIDEWYDRALGAGSLGGKVLGAGGGGFLLLYVDQAHRGQVIKALPELKPLDFTFEPQGSKIIYVE